MVELWSKMHASHSNPHTRVELRKWCDDMGALAELIWRCRPDGAQPVVKIYGYSWGGFSATLLARQLGRRGISVRHMILSDAVYRHWYWAGDWRAFWPWSKIKIPANVYAVNWFRQRESLPSGHDLVAEDPETYISEPTVALVDHLHMDDLDGFHKSALAAAML